MDRLYGTLLKAVQNSLNHCNYENALFLCSRAESLCPRRPEAMYYRALSLFQEGQPMAAYGLLVLSENIKTGLHLSSAFLLARVCFELGKLQEAERLLVDLLSRLDSCVSADIHKLIPQVDPAEAYHLLGRIQRRTNRTQNAIVSFQRAFELNPLAWESFKELCELGALDGLEEDKDWFTMERIGAWMDEISSKEAPVKPRATTGTSKAASTTGPKRRVVGCI